MSDENSITDEELVVSDEELIVDDNEKHNYVIKIILYLLEK